MARRGNSRKGKELDAIEDDDVPVTPVGNEGRSARPAPNVRRVSVPPSARSDIPARHARTAASAEGSAQNGDAPDIGCSQSLEVDCSQNTGEVGGSQNAGGFDTSSIPVSRRSGDNAKHMFASTGVEVPVEFDKIGVGFIWTQSFYCFSADRMSDSACFCCTGEFICCSIRCISLRHGVQRQCITWVKHHRPLARGGQEQRSGKRPRSQYFRGKVAGVRAYIHSASRGTHRTFDCVLSQLSPQYS